MADRTDEVKGTLDLGRESSCETTRLGSACQGGSGWESMTADLEVAEDDLHALPVSAVAAPWPG